MQPRSVTADWDAESYHRASDVMFEWGKRFADRAHLAGDEVVLDAGCGTGRVTAAIRDRVPRGRVIGVDASADMIRLARETLGENAELIHADLLELELDEPVDVVFSTSTLHWIKDHDRLVDRLHAATRPGGRVVAQCGGAGNVADLVDAIVATSHDPPFAEHLHGYESPWYHPTPEAMGERLRAAGFRVSRCETGHRVLELPKPREWHRSVGLQLQLSKLPDELRDPFVDSVLSRRSSPSELSFVRLDIEATRPAD